MSENPLIGCWKLISCDALRNHGARVPAYGKRPTGRLFYDDLGNMSVHIMRSGRPCRADAGAVAQFDGSPNVAHDGYQAYFSTYCVDTEHRMVTHTVLGSLAPEWTGTTQVRYYELEGRDRLRLRTAPVGALAADGPVFELVWERIKEKPSTITAECLRIGTLPT